MTELTDADHRVVRRNDVVFEEGADEANNTISRKHAHIQFAAGEYRISRLVLRRYCLGHCANPCRSLAFAPFRNA